MTPKEKAEELINNLYEIHCKVFKADTSEERATRYRLLHPICKEIAILSVDEIIRYCHAEHIKYWIEVKTEIEENKD